MKKIIHLIGIFTVVLFSNIGNAQISDYEICDVNADGYGAFDLTTKVDEILDGVNPSDYIVTFHEVYDDALLNVNPTAPTLYFNIVPYIQVIYVRIENLNDSTFEVESFNLVVYSPQIGMPDNLYSYDGIFDLTINDSLITQGNSYAVFYYLTETDAYNNVNPITNPTNFVSVDTTIWARAEDTNGCFSMISFEISTIVYIPDANFKAKLLEADTTIEIALNSNVQAIKIDINNDNKIQVSEALNVFGLNVNSSNIEDLTGVEAFTNLTNLSFGWNQIASADLSNNINLADLICHNNILTELNTSNNINLTFLRCENNLLTELDFSNNVNLEEVWCQNNNFTELDFSNNYFLKYIDFGENPNLQYLNIKNGSDSLFYWLIEWYQVPYICADEFEIEDILPYSTENQIISTYCSFEPAGDYNTIIGSVFFTDSGNCDEEDITFLTKITIDDGTDGGASFTNQDGEYMFFVQDGTFTITPEIENPSYFNVTPITETVTFADNDNNEEIVNFCITPNGVHKDLEVIIAPIIPARPGFEATYKIVYRNKGNQVMSQDYGLNFFYNQQLTSFVSASVAPDTQGPGGLNWSYEDLMPFESREIVVTMQINTPTDPENPVNIDDELIFTSAISPQANDENVTDNIYILNQIVVGSYDPNDITCIEGDVVHPDTIGEELHYLIRFENTGNYYAENIVVAMEIDTLKYDVDSVRLLNTSHNANAQIKDNVLEVFFNQIMLDSGGHGNILLVMKSVNSLSEGDSVQSKADIYFDFNYPIITNDAVTLFQATMSIEDNIKNIDVRFYPNPTTDYFNITSEAMIQSVELYDISGRLVRTSLVNDFETRQNVGNLTNGVHILKIKTQEGEVIGKIVKK